MNLHRYIINKRVGNEQLVREVDRKRHRELVMAGITALVLALAVLAYAWQHFEMIRIGYRVEELRIERQHLFEIQRELLLERASLASPDRVEAIAVRQLGMIRPTSSQVVVIEPFEVGEVDEVRDVEQASSRDPRKRK